MAIEFDTDAQLGHIMITEGWSTKITCVDGQTLTICHNVASDCKPPIHESGRINILSSVQVYIPGAYESNWCAYQRQKHEDGYIYRFVGTWFVQSYILKHGGIDTQETIK